jgi:hypothetical protein
MFQKQEFLSKKDEDVSRVLSLVGWDLSASGSEAPITTKRWLMNQEAPMMVVAAEHERQKQAEDWCTHGRMSTMKTLAPYAGYTLVVDIGGD